MKNDSSKFDVAQITFPDDINGQNFAERRSKHSSVSTLIRILKCGVIFTENFAKH